MGVSPAAAKLPLTRRGALGACTLTLSALSLDGCGAHHLHPKLGPVPRADIPIIAGLLALEFHAVAAYEAGIPLLEPHSPEAKAATQFLPQEESHAGELQGLLKKAGIKPPPRQPLTTELGHPQTAADVLALLERLEAAQLRAYLAALPRLTGGMVRQAVAAVLANDAQHLAVLRAQSGRSPAPAAFVSGRE